MSKIMMDHPEGSRRSKDSREVQQMIWQYESQISTCKDEQAVSLMKQKLGKLRKLVEGEDRQV